MEKNNQSRVEAIMEKYKRDLQKLLNGDKRENFDDITNRTLSELKKEVKDTSEETIANDSKKKLKNKARCPNCGREARLNQHDAKKELVTANFRFTITRNLFYCRNCGTGFSHIDEKEIFNLFEEHNITKNMAEEMAYSAQNSLSFEKGALNIQRYKDVVVSESIVRTVSERIGQMIHETDCEEAKQAYNNPEQALAPNLEKKERGVLYNLVDGSMVNTMEKNEKGSSWTEMKLGLVFHDQNVIKRKDNKHMIMEKEYVALLGSAEEFKKLFFNTSLRAGYGSIAETVFLGDGAAWIWNMCDELFPDAVQILDFYHLTENVYKFAKYYHANNEQQVTPWVNGILDGIEEGKINEIIKQFPDLTGTKLPAGVPNLKVYLTNNINRIKYSEYKEKGYSIGSGAVESANKGVIQQRLKQPGMRWSKLGGQYIATLRAISASKKWDDVMEFIQAA